MGSIFDQDKIYFAAATAKLFRGDNDPIKDAALGAVLNNESTPSYIQATGLAGPGTTIRQYNNYGKSTYINGLPTISLHESHPVSGALGSAVPIEIISADPAYEGQLKPLDLYPIIEIKRDGEYVYDTNTSESKYITTRRIMKKAGMSLKQITEIIKENPDSPSIDDASFVFGADIYTQEESTIEYLHAFFKKMEAISPVDENAFNTSLLPGIGGWTENPIRNAIRTVEGDFVTNFTYDFISIGETPMGETDAGADHKSSFFHDGYTDYEVSGNDDPNIYRVFHAGVIFYKRQANNPDMADIVTVHGVVVEIEAAALGDDGRLSKPMDSKFEHLDYDDPLYGTSGLYIPLSHDVIPLLRLFDRHRALTDCMLLAFVAAEEVHLEWYQTGIIKIIIMAVAFYLLSTGIGAGIANLGTMSAQTFILSAVAAIGLSYLVDLILTKVDGILGIIISLAAIWAAGQLAKSTGAFAAMPLGSNSLEIMTTVGYIAKKHATVETRELIEQIEKMKEEQEVETAELAELMAANPTMDKDFLNLIVAAVTSPPSESASTYQSRTLDLGMVIDFSINQAENYLENMLTLPEPNFSPKYA